MEVLMKFKLLLSAIYVGLTMQSAVWAAYSAPARSAESRSFKQISDKYGDVGWSSRLERLMNPQYFQAAPALAAPQATVQPEVLNSLMVVPQESAIVPSVSMNSMVPFKNNRVLAKQYVGNFNPLRGYVTRFFEALDDFDNRSENILLKVLNAELFHEKRKEFLISKFQETEALRQLLDDRDVENINYVDRLQNVIVDAIEAEDFMIRNPEMKKRQEEHRQRAAKAYQDFLDFEAEKLDEELTAGIPVENPYEQVKQDVKNQFTRGAKIGAIGAGTLYGLQKYKKANNLK